MATLVSAPQRAGAGAVENARAYLAISQLPSGLFRQASLADTAEALAAIEDPGVKQAAQIAALITVPGNNEDGLARLAVLSAARSGDPVAATALRASLASGELGLAPGSAAWDPMVLAWALRFAAADASSTGLVPLLALQIQARARPDGGYGFADNASDLALTSEMVRALRAAGPLYEAYAAPSVQWVAAQISSANLASLSATDLALAILAAGGALPADRLTAAAAALALRQGPDGSFDGDVRATALAIQAQRIAAPDLSVAFSATQDLSPVSGASYIVAVRVTNGGVSPSPATVLRYTVADGTGTQAGSGQVQVGALAPGQTSLVNLDLGPQGAPGARVLTAVVNPDATFFERDFASNLGTLRFQVMGRPDLVIDATDLSIAPSPPPLHQAAKVTVRVRNVGSAVARNVHAQLFAGPPGAGGILIAEQFFNAVAPGTPRLIVAEFTPTTMLATTLVARVDPEDAIAEVDEGNNQATLTVQPVEPAAILADVTPVLTTGATIVQGNTLGLYYGATVTVTRYGQSYPVPELWPFDRVTTSLLVGPPGAETEVARQELPKASITLGSGQSKYFSMSTNGLDGPITFTVRADVDDRVAEVNESNNVATATFTITTADLPELWIDPATVRVDPPLVAPGAAYTVHGTIHNSGKRSVTGIRVDLGGRTVTVPALAPGDSMDVPVSLTAGAAGRYDFQYYVDPTAQIAEGTRVNNVAPVVVYVGRSDLEIASVVVDPNPVSEGATAYVTATFRNIGTSSETGNVSASVQRGSTVVATGGPVPYPAPGAYGSITVPVSTTGMKGDTAATVKLAFSSWTTRAIQADFTLPVRNPDFAVSPRAIQIVRSAVAQSRDIQASVVVNNLGNGPGTTSVRLYRGYREQESLVASGTLSIPAGGSAVFQSSWFPLLSDGATVLTAVVDEEGAVLELDEGNNLASRDVDKAPGEIVIAFDEGRTVGYTISTNPTYQNDANTTGGYADWAKDLEARGFTVRTINPGDGGPSSSTLRAVDVLVIQAASGTADVTVYSPGEITAVRDFLTQGGSVLFIGDWGPREITNQYTGVRTPLPWVAAQDAFLQEFGWGNAHICVRNPAIPSMDRDMDTWFARQYGQITNHPAMDGIGLVHGSWSGGLASMPPGAAPMVVMGNGQVAEEALTYTSWPATYPVVASASYGAGRMVVVTDSNFFDSKYLGPHTPGYYLGENRRFALQLVDWLAGGPSRDAWPDLVFSPPAIEGPAIVVGGDIAEYAVTVKNVGDTIVGNTGFAVRLYDGEPALGHVIGEARVEPLGVDETKRVAFTWDSSHAEGRHTLTAVVDPLDEVREFDEQRNSVSLGVLVRSALDLRLDPSDVVIAPGTPPVVSVRVHNQGYRSCPSGGVLTVAGRASGSAFWQRQADLPAVPARGAVTIQFPWTEAWPSSSAFDLVATAQLPTGGGYDGDGTNDSTWRQVAPPELAVQAPAAGTQWAGKKSVRWTARSRTRPNLVCSVAVAPVGGDFTGVPGTTCGQLELDTTRYADGSYLVRVTADDGLQRSQQDTPIQIANASTAVRTFGAAPGTASASLATGTATTVVRIPVGTRVTSATLALAPVPAARGVIDPVVPYDAPVVIRQQGTLHLFHASNTGGLWTRRSFDEGATWTAAQQLANGPTVTVQGKSVASNSAGLHLAFTEAGGLYYRRSTDGGLTWSLARLLGTQTNRIRLEASEEGLVILHTGYAESFLTVADREGQFWGPVVRHITFTGPLAAAIRGGKLHLIAGSTSNGGFYRSADPARYADSSAYSAPLPIVEAGAYTQAVTFARDAILVARAVYPVSTSIQRCPLERDCGEADSWLPEPPAVATYLNQLTLAPVGGDGRLAYQGSSTMMGAYGAQGGAAWGEPGALGPWGSLSEPGFLLEDDEVLGAGRYQSFDFVRTTGLVPADVRLDIGGDGSAEQAITGRLAASVQSPDLSAAFNAWLSSHADADDGAADGFIAVPLRVTSSGLGQVQLADLEITYLSTGALAGFAEPPVFSPSASPAVLDTSTLSTLSPGPIVVTDSSAVSRRALTATAASGRYLAAFDGRDGSGTVLPSGRYLFGPAGSPVGVVEIDDIPPTAQLRVGNEGSFGGLAPIHGLATDRDWTGSAKNFARYLLEASSDGLVWQTIATSTTATDGVLGHLDTRRMVAGPVTLRLTVFDRAGNSAVDSRQIGVSPGAPIAPVITSPTIAGKPVDALGVTVALAGTAEAGTTVTVYRDGTAVGTTPCDGRWALAAVALPEGLSTFTASASRAGVEGPRSQPIQVARYALEVVVSAPSSAASGSSFDATVTVRRTSVEAVPVRVVVGAHDGAGHALALTLSPAEATMALPATGSASFVTTVSTRGLPASTLFLRAQAVEGARAPVSGEASVAIGTSGQLLATLFSDRAAYDALQAVSLTARIENLGTEAQGPLTASIAVTAPGGQVTSLGPWTVDAVPAGGRAVLSALHGGTALATGLHVAELVVRDAGGAVVATGGTSFQVTAASGSALTGTLLVTPSTYARGELLHAAFTVTNRGATASVPLTLLLLSPATNAIVTRWDGSLPVVSGATASSEATLSTAAADGQDLLVVLLGNGRPLAAQTVTPIPFQDLTPPVITITGVAEGELRAAPVTPVVSITDESAFSSTTLLNGSAFTSGTQVTADGDHLLAVSAVDAWGNSASAQRSFAIDRTPPVLSIGGVQPGQVTRGPITPVVTASDAHPGTPAWTATLSGAAWAGGAVSAEGDWLLAAAATDAAGNTAAPASVSFSIDTTPPQIAVSGVSDGQLSRVGLRPAVTVTDAHPGTTTLTLDGAPFTSGSLVSAEGDHLLAASAVDAAGNTAGPVQVHFGIDATPPVVTITGVAQGGTYLVEARPSFTVSDAHPGTATATLDGATFAQGSAVKTSGSHTFAVSAIDLAGNTTSRSVTFQVTPVVATVTASVDSASPRVLAVVNCAGQPASCITTQAKVLMAAFDYHGISYEIAPDATTFLAKLRENRHNVRMVYRAGSSATNAYWELRELTYEGGGLVVVNDGAADSDPKLVDTLGVAMGGKITTVGTLTITAGDLGPARSFSVSGSGIAQTLRASTALAPGKSSKGTVATTNRYGRGRAVTLTLNPEANYNLSMKDLLAQAVRFAAGGAVVAGVPGAPQYVKLQSTLTSPSGPLNFRLDAWTGTGLTPLSDAGTPVTPPRSWSFPLTAPVTDVRLMGVTSGQKGTYPVLAELNMVSGGPFLVASGSVDVVVVGSIAELRQAAITATQAIPNGTNDSARAAALAHLQAVNAAPTTKTACASSIDQTLQATDDLQLISGTAAADARVKCDQLLRALQALYPTLP